MRHFGSLLLAAVFAPAIFLLTGSGLSAFGSAREGTFIDDPLSTLAAMGALLLAGLLYGVLVMVRLSPVGPGLAGLVLMGTSGWALVAPSSYDETFSQLDVHMGGAVGQWGLGILLGVPLLATLTSPRRWRSDGDNPDSAPPVQYYQPSIPDSTRQMPRQSADLTLPDVAPPSLRYPAAPAAPVADAPPLPKRLPTPATEDVANSEEPTKPLS